MLEDSKKCCGCSACVQICPKHSISFQEDREGFWYPKIDIESCANCKLCEKVCPIINQNSERESLEAFAARNNDEDIRLKSSSGGLFTLLAESIIDEGGVVFGARFNENWDVVHDYTETKEGLVPFRGSKYVQSNIGDSYVLTESFLKSGRSVMFTGTPCQIAGLRKYLRKEYDNLLAVDVICHGVPSPLVWRRYLEEKTAEHDGVVPILTGVNFRDKSMGWKNFSFVLRFFNESANEGSDTIQSSIFQRDDYMRAFLSNLSLRPSCYDCQAKSGKSSADITIGDFWGIENILPELDDDKGLNLVVVNSTKGLTYLKTLTSELVPVGFKEAVKSNSAYSKSVLKPLNREYFFHCIEKGSNVQDAVNACESINMLYRIRRLIYRKFGI